MRTYTGTFTANNITYKYKLTAPDALVYIYSKHVYCQCAITDSDDNPTINAEVKCRITGTSSTFNNRFTDANGLVTFDIARTLQVKINELSGYKLSDELELRYSTSQLAKTKSMSLMFYAFNQNFKNVTIEAAHGANDILDQFWRGKRRLRWFKNYPFTFDFQNINGNWQVATNDGSYLSASFPYVKTELERVMARINANLLWHGESNVNKKSVKGITTMAMNIDGGLSTVTMTLDLIADNETLDLKRNCYLRWLGKHGEVFYWLFRRHSQTDSVTSEVNRMSESDDAWNGNYILVNENKANYTKETSIVLYSLPVDGVDYETIKSIVTSPLVDMLVDYTIHTTPRTNQSPDARQIATDFYETARWQRVIVDKGNYTISLKGDQYKNDKQLVLKIIIPEEGGLRV